MSAPLRKPLRQQSLLTKAIRQRLIANGQRQELVRGSEDEIDFKPVVKLFDPCGSSTWLLTELDPHDPDIAFGLCYIFEPELGSVRICELEAHRGPLGLGIERDRHFNADKTLSAYAEEVRAVGYIKA